MERIGFGGAEHRPHVGERENGDALHDAPVPDAPDAVAHADPGERHGRVRRVLFRRVHHICGNNHQEVVLRKIRKNVDGREIGKMYIAYLNPIDFGLKR